MLNRPTSRPLGLDRLVAAQHPGLPTTAAPEPRHGPSPVTWLLIAFAVALAIAVAARGWNALPAARPTTDAVTTAPVIDLESTQDHVIAGSWFELMLTTPRFPTGTAAGGGLDERLVALMNRSRRTLDVAIYEFNLRNVAEAMERAADRGVRVRMVTDSDTLNDKDAATQAALDLVRTAGIPIVGDGRRPLMHDKFIVVDGEWVETGSANYTDREAYRNNNNAIFVQSRSLAQNYTAEFEKMFGGQFGQAKPRGIPHQQLTLAGVRMENYFSPQDRAGTQVARWMSAARQRIHFMAFSFTLDALGDTALQRSRAGVEVAGVFESGEVGNSFSEFQRLKEAGLDVMLDGNPWNLHHKVMIIDDHVTIFGSFNFSASADRENDENLLIVEDVSLARAFEEEYQRVRALAISPPAGVIR